MKIEKEQILEEPTQEESTTEIDLENAFNTEELLLVGAKTIVGIGLGFIVVIFGTTGLGAILETTVIPTALTKAAGAMVGGAFGLSKGISDSRKKKHRKCVLPC